MDTFPAAAALLVLIAAAACLIHRFDIRHAGIIAVYRYSAARLPGHRGRGTPRPPVEPDL
ncbi:hypothetical protein [Streptomyces achromogenes]|uniref:hypothetical protein n=1 Tax=Streptomyces achromogenes TaxID=67255 RepID=UPI0033C408D7